MRESCSCGAAIHTWSYKRAIAWRLTHQHGNNEIVDLTGTEFGTGFQPNPASADEEED